MIDIWVEVKSAIGIVSSWHSSQKALVSLFSVKLISSAKAAWASLVGGQVVSVLMYILPLWDVTANEAHSELSLINSRLSYKKIEVRMKILKKNFQI